MAKKTIKKLPVEKPRSTADQELVLGGYEPKAIDEENLQRAMSATMSSDECFKVVEVKFWGKDGCKATLIVKSKADLSRLECAEDECREAKNVKPGQLLPVYEYGARTLNQIEALPKEAVPEAVATLIKRKSKKISGKKIQEISMEENDGVQ